MEDGMNSRFKSSSNHFMFPLFDHLGKDDEINGCVFVSELSLELAPIFPSPRVPFLVEKTVINRKWWVQ